jgi:hypothetical protein
VKKIDSSIKALPGWVGLFDPIPLDKMYLIEELLYERNKQDTSPDRRAELHRDFFKAVFSCVQEWHLEGLPGAITLEDLSIGGKMKRKVMAELESWLTAQVMALYYEDDTDPNA